jgi:hypothetical protein
LLTTAPSVVTVTELDGRSAAESRTPVLSEPGQPPAGTPPTEPTLPVLGAPVGEADPAGAVGDAEAGVVGVAVADGLGDAEADPPDQLPYLGWNSTSTK